MLSDLDFNLSNLVPTFITFLCDALAKHQTGLQSVQATESVYPLPVKPNGAVLNGKEKAGDETIHDAICAS
jgi:hypothetical protein